MINSSAFQTSSLPRQPQGLFARIVAFLLSAALLVVGFMFSLAALAVVAVIGVGFAGWLWWKTRAIRRQMRAAQAGMRTASPRTGADDIIEGEFVREPLTPPERQLP